MPLTKSISKKAFGKNIGAEIRAGKPKAQAAAIAYSVQQEAKKKHRSHKAAFSSKDGIYVR